MNDRNFKMKEMNMEKKDLENEESGLEALPKQTETLLLDTAKKNGENGMESKKRKIPRTGYHIKYAGARGKGVVVTLPEDPRKHICSACKKSVAAGEIRMTALHHWWYAYQPDTVRENPILAVENTSELCFGCHPLGDAIRALLYANPIRVAQVAELLRGEPRERFIRVLEEVLKRLKDQDIGLAKKILESVK